MKTKRILSVLLTFVIAFSLLPNFTLTASAATTILFYPSETWNSIEGRYAVRYENDAGVGWATVNTTLVAGCYSASIPECYSFQFCLMYSLTEENNENNVNYRSVAFNIPETGENCLILYEELVSPGGYWTFESISTNSIDVLYFKPNEEWINSELRMVAYFFTEENAIEEWVDLTATGVEGIYSVEAPESFDYVAFFLMNGQNNTFEEARYCTNTYSYEGIAGYNCLVLATNDGSNMTPGAWMLDEELAAYPGTGGETEDGSGDEAEGGTGSEDVIQDCNVVYGSSADDMSNEGNLRNVISSHSETVYIRLTNNVMLEEQIVVDGKNIYLDLANYNIDVVEYGFVITNGGSLTLSASTEATLTEAETIEDEATEEEVIKDDSFVPGELQGAVYSTHASKNGVGLFDVEGVSDITFESGIYVAQHGVIVTSELSTITVNGGKYKTSLSLPIFRLNNYTELYINGGCFLGAENVIEINANTRPHIHITDFDKECEHISMVLTSDEIQETSTSFVLIQNNDLMIYMIHDGEKTVTDHAPLGEPFYVGWCHKVTYDVNGGTHIALNEYRFPIPGYIKFPAWNTMNEPYMMEFSHWECNGKDYQTGETLYVEETGTSTLKAIWKEQVQYNVTLHSNLDPEQTQTTKEYSMYLPLSEVPSDWTVPEELTLLGWAFEPDGTASWSKLKLTGDTDLYAIYTTKRYDINFSTNGGSGIIHQIMKTHDVDCYLPSEYPVREGYKFCGWSETRDGEAIYQPGGIYTKNERIWLYAVWEENSYTVSYNLNDGVGNIPTQTKMYTKDLTLTETIPTRECYDFLGWSNTETGDVIYESGDTYTQNSNITLYAVWKLKEYTITYDANGGENTPVTQTKIHNDDLTLSSQIPTKTGCEFKGWSETLNGEVIYQPGEIYTKNERITLYAVWEIVEFNIISYDTETKTATISIPEAGAYTVVFADYENGVLANIEFVPVTVTDAEIKTAAITKSFNLGTNDKILLWQNMTSIKHLCGAYILE